MYNNNGRATKERDGHDAKTYTDSCDKEVQKECTKKYQD
jgi:hypothetical protein